MIPAWLLSKTALTVGLATVLLASAGLWYRGQMKAAAREAVAEERTRVIKEMEEKQKVVIEALQDSLEVERARTDTLIVHAAPVVGTYARERERSAAIPQPAGLPLGTVLVTEAFVAAADSAVRQIPILIAAVERERGLADLRITAADDLVALKDQRIVQLEILVKEAGPSLKDKGLYAAIGAGLTFLAIEVLK